MSIHSLRFKKLQPIISLNKLFVLFQRGRLSPISSPIDHQSDLFMGKCLSGLKHTVFQLERFASFFFRSVYSQLSSLSTSRGLVPGSPKDTNISRCSLPFVSAILIPWIHQSWYCMSFLKKTHV